MKNSFFQSIVDDVEKQKMREKDLQHRFGLAQIHLEAAAAATATASTASAPAAASTQPEPTEDPSQPAPPPPADAEWNNESIVPSIIYVPQ